jgi:pimeloyl-ACP methyl ester carboxylesterase
MKSNNIIINGTKLHYLEYGSNNLTPLILIHGFHSCAEQMSDFANYISPYFHLIVPDLPGFGESKEYQDNFNLEKSAKTLLAFLKAKQIYKYFLSGFSMGAAVALEMLLNDPNGCQGNLFIYPLAMGSHIKYSSGKKKVVKYLVSFAKSPLFNPLLKKMFHSDRIMYFLFKKLSASGVSTDADLKRRIINSRMCSFNTYIYGVSSIFGFQPSREKKFPGLKTIIVLNKNDELIDSRFTLKNYRNYFPNLIMKYLNLGSHNPTRKENNQAFNRLFPPLLQDILNELGVRNKKQELRIRK